MTAARTLNIATLRQTFESFNADKAPRLAAAIAYATIFSLAPLFIILIAVVGGILGVAQPGHAHSQAEDMLLAQVQHAAGTSAADTVRQLISASFGKPRQSIIAQIIGWLTFIFGASGLFSALQDGLNTVWGIEATKGGWRQMLRDRLASVSMIAIVGFLIIVSFIANAALAIIGTHFAELVPLLNNPILAGILYQAVTIAIATIIFSLLFKVLPDVHLEWSDVWIGGLATAVLFVIGEALISLYLAYAGVASAYGAAGSLLVALLWIYYSAMILLLGAEFTKVYARHVQTTTATVIRNTTEHPEGVDPRNVGGERGGDDDAHVPTAAKPHKPDVPAVDGVASIRADIDGTRQRIADLTEAVVYKLDFRARTQDEVSARLSSVGSTLAATTGTIAAAAGEFADNAGASMAEMAAAVRDGAGKTASAINNKLHDALDAANSEHQPQGFGHPSKPPGG